MGRGGRGCHRFVVKEHTPDVIQGIVLKYIRCMIL